MTRSAGASRSAGGSRATGGQGGASAGDGRTSTGGAAAAAPKRAVPGSRWRDLWYRGAVHQWRLNRGGISQLLFVPPDPWPGSSERGGAIVGGAISFTRDTIFGDDLLPIDPHGFAWLRDLRATGSEAGRRRGRELMRDWIDRYGRYDRAAWQPALIAERLVAWLSHYDYFCRDADGRFREAFFRSVHRQANHLAQLAPTTAGAARIRAAKGLVYAGACFPGGTRRLARGLSLIEAAAHEVVAPDGGLPERNPSLMLEALRDLVDVRAVLSRAQREHSALLQTAIDRVAPLLRFFRHGDGRLALFNGGFEEEDWQIDVVLNQSDAKGKAPVSAPQTGYQRLVGGRTVVLVDSGAPPGPGFDARGHAGTLSFEMSVGRSRLIVNCGAAYYDDPDWRDVGRLTAAHSTLVLGDANSSQVVPGGLGGRPKEVVCQRHDDEGNVWLELSHDGYLGRFGYVHERKLFLARGGEDLRGEDILIHPEGSRVPRRGRDATYSIRFHLHPEVVVDNLSVWEKGGRFVQFHRPGAGIWRLQTEEIVDVQVDDSSYLGDKGFVERGRQIVLTGLLGDAPRLSVRWAIKRLG